MFYITGIPSAENSEGEEPYFKVRGNMIAVVNVPEDVISQRYKKSHIMVPTLERYTWRIKE